MTKATVWIDGASRGNPGESGFGVLAEHGDERREICGFLGRTTNNVAEYAGLLAALLWARREGVQRLEIFSDSQLLVRQFSGAYKVKAPNLVPLFLRMLEIRRGIPQVEAHHVRREENRHADMLANRAIDERVTPPDWITFDLPTA